jgi:hypothetical protein
VADQARRPDPREQTLKGGLVTEIHHGVSADGRSVAEAEVAGLAEARELLAAASAAGAELAWAHSAADLTSLGFRGQPGYRRLTGPARPAPTPAPDGVTELSGAEDTAELCAAAYRGQWGHKTPGDWAAEELAATTVLALRRGREITGVCRITPDAGLIDAPGLLDAPDCNQEGYRLLLAAGLARITTGQATVESWGDGPGRVRACTELGLSTAEYTPGWELDLAGQAGHG